MSSRKIYLEKKYKVHMFKQITSAKKVNRYIILLCAFIYTSLSKICTVKLYVPHFNVTCWIAARNNSTLLYDIKRVNTNALNALCNWYKHRHDRFYNLLFFQWRNGKKDQRQVVSFASANTVSLQYYLFILDN